MTRWVEVDVGICRTPAMLDCSNGAKLVYVAGACYCAEHRTGSLLPRSVVEQLVEGLDIPPTAIDELINCGLWHPSIDGIETLGNETLWKDGGCDTAELRAAWNRIKSTVTPRIMARDGAFCALCGVTERLTVDHIIPLVWGGSSDDDNLRILCAPCNSRKGARL